MRTRVEKHLPPDRRCFVISPIGSPDSEARRRADKILRHVIKPVCAELGFAARRADELSEPSLITRAVVQELLASDLVIADLTGANPNVYYELAIRHFIGRPVVQLIEAGEHIPFDVSDVNTIKVDHRDLDSVEAAKESLATLIRNGIAVTVHETPITAVLERLGISVQGVSRVAKSLAEQFENLSQQIIEELTSARKERDLLWRTLRSSQEAPPAGVAEPSSNGDFSGLWQSNLGYVRLIQDGNALYGSYEYKLSATWIGEIRGKIVNDRIIFHWRWTDRERLRGLGYWDTAGRGLVGRWYYQTELNRSLNDLERDPGYFDREEIKIGTGEDRTWNLSRADVKIQVV